MKKKLIYLFLIIIMIIALSACIKRKVEPMDTPIPPAKPTRTPSLIVETEDPANKPVNSESTDFETGEGGFFAGFADYPKDKAENYDFSAQVMDIPDVSSKGYYFSGNNHSADLMMYLTKGINALENTRYTIMVNFDVATNMPRNLESPGASVFVKAGASNIPFTPIIAQDNYLRSNWDIGNQGEGGIDGITLGDLEKINSEDEIYQYKHFSGTFTVTTLDDGMIYVLFAIDSEIETTTSIYFDNIIIETSAQ